MEEETASSNVIYDNLPVDPIPTDQLGSGPFSVLPPAKVVNKILAHISVTDKRNCRLVCLNWNLAVTKSLKFSAKLSDMSMLTFLRIRRIEDDMPQLNIVKIVAVDLSPLSFPFNSEGLQDQLKTPQSVKQLHFMDGVSSVIKQNILLSCKWIEHLKFEKTPVPIFPEGLILNNLTKFEMSPGAYNESNEVEMFFQKVCFPFLKETSIQIHCRNDYCLYAAVHYFAARHHRSLRNLKLLFLESLTPAIFYNKDTYSKDFKQMMIHQRRKIERTPQYTDFLDHVKLLNLDSLNLWLIDTEEFLALSFILIKAQKGLTALEINHPNGSSYIHNDFTQIIENNCETLRKLTIPRLPKFDCSILKSCSILEMFSLGMEFHFYDFNSYGSVTNVHLFPNLCMLRTVSMGSPMTKAEIYWMFNHIEANTFLFIARKEDEYSLNDVKKLIESGPEDKKVLMMCVTMAHPTFKSFQAHLSTCADIGVRVIYHCQPNEVSPGTAHFSLQFD